MKETYYIGAYWGNRFESRAACTERLLQTMTELASSHELCTTWHETADSLKEALQKRITPTRDALEQLLEPHEPDEPDSEFKQEFLEALGYSFACWNGQTDDKRSMGLSASCGGAIDVPSLPNAVVLTLPNPSDAVASLYNPDVLFRILRAITIAWEPDWGVVMSRAYRDDLADPDNEQPSGKPYVGWMTYLRDKRLAGLTGAPPCEVVEILGRGRIFVVTRAHRFSVANPGDVKAAQTLTEYLEAGGALVTIPTDEPF